MTYEKLYNIFLLPSLKCPHSLRGGAAYKSGQRTAQGTVKADWQEVFSKGTDPPAQAGTREEVGKTISYLSSLFTFVPDFGQHLCLRHLLGRR